MMTLISLAISVAFLFSLAVTFGFPGMDLWWELATLVAIMVLGHWVEMASISQAQGALKELAKLLPSIATRVHGEHMEEVPLDQLRDGDIILVRPGSSVPADGFVRDGSSTVNESMITGESQPVEKQPGEKVIAGTVNGSGSLRIEVTGTGDRTALAGIMRLGADAQSSRSRAQALADRAAFFLTVVAIVAGAVTLVVWLLVGATPAYAIERLVTVLVIAGDVVLVRSDPRDIPRIIALSRATYRKMIQNLWWAAGYNIVAIPLAAGVLAPIGIVLHPAVGAVLMSLSTIIVALNAQLLRRVRLS
jgi:Cu2+-exporting ATPase